MLWFVNSEFFLEFLILILMVILFTHFKCTYENGKYLNLLFYIFLCSQSFDIIPFTHFHSYSHCGLLAQPYPSFILIHKDQILPTCFNEVMNLDAKIPEYFRDFIFSNSPKIVTIQFFYMTKLKLFMQFPVYDCGTSYQFFYS